ncbi:MAG: DUF3179 domain-containing protein [Chloroflexi bacterium]|nr:MAG: DUF3179 domain-containing protein [Chloroflexota bacterium]
MARKWFFGWILLLVLVACTGVEEGGETAVSVSPPSKTTTPIAQAPARPTLTVEASVPAGETAVAAAQSPIPPTALSTDTPLSVPTVPPAATNTRVDVGEDIRFPWLLPFDSIPPVYDPQFVSANNSPLDPDELIIGISLGQEAKAYPISVLRFREMVNDELAGIPILVTW